MGRDEVPGRDAREHGPPAVGMHAGVEAREAAAPGPAAARTRAPGRPRPRPRARRGPPTRSSVSVKHTLPISASRNGLAVAGRAPVVHEDHRVPRVDERLDLGIEARRARATPARRAPRARSGTARLPPASRRTSGSPRRAGSRRRPSGTVDRPAPARRGSRAPRDRRRSRIRVGRTPSLAANHTSPSGRTARVARCRRADRRRAPARRAEVQPVELGTPVVLVPERAAPTPSGHQSTGKTAPGRSTARSRRSPVSRSQIAGRSNVAALARDDQPLVAGDG